MVNRNDGLVSFANSILESVFFIGFVLLCMIRPDCINDIESLKYISILFSILQIVCSCMIVLLFLVKNGLSFSNCWIIGLMLLLLGSSFFSPILEGLNVKGIIKTTLLCLFFNMAIHTNKYVLFKACRLLDLYIFVDFLTVIIFPNGMYATKLYKENWFLGYKNPQMRLIIGIVFLSILSSYVLYNELSISTVMVIVTSCCICIMTKSMNGMIGIFMLLILFYISLKLKIRMCCTAIAMLISSFITIIVAASSTGITRVMMLVSSIGKQKALSGRLSIWCSSITLIKNKWIMGYGLLTHSDFARLFGKTWALHPHNFTLYMLITGGGLAYLFFLCGIAKFDMSMKRINDIRYINLFETVLLVFLFIGMTESLMDTSILYVIITIGIDCKSWDDMTVENNYSRHVKLTFSHGR